MKVIKNKNVISENLSDKTFILNNDTGVYIELNETAAELWGSFKYESSSEELTSFLVNEYEIDTKLAKGDVSLFIKECITCKLLLKIEI
jgi:hypothetical protein